jgi:hypothetical protein
MNRPFPHSRFSTSPSFALISVLALVSLAALTATAFLASARLERQATMSLPAATRLDMAMHAAACGAAEMVDYAPSKHFNYVTTYWRGTNSTDWTNELGYLLSGAVQLTNNKTSTIYNYNACFSTATLTNLGTNPSTLVVVTNTVSNQATFSTQIGSFMATMTNFGPGQSTNIPLLGDSPTNRYLSPPVGWVYINQDVRTKAGSTNTANIPVIRFAFYVQDLSSLIDSTRMGSTTNYRASTYVPPPNYMLGTNPAEISLTNATGTSLTNSSKFSNFVLDKNRAKYLSPGTLTLSTAGGLSTNDLRYVTTGLRHWTNAYARIPIGLGYGNSWDLKAVLSSNFISSASSVSTIAFLITNNLTNFTSRAGGMNSNAYVSNIAANIVDYADTNSTPIADSLTSPGYIGIENIPWPNELFDTIQFANVLWGKQMLVLDVKDQVEVWNMGNKPIPASVSTNSAITISNNYDLVLTFTNTFLGVSQRVNLKDLVTQDAGTVWPRYRVYSNPVIPPNGYAVLSAWKRSSDNYTHTTVAYTAPAAVANIWFPNTNAAGRSLISSSWYVYPAQADATTNMTYVATYNGQVIQKSKGGRWTRYLAPSFKMANNNLGLTPSQYVFLNPIGYASQTSISGTPTHSGGDPRAQYFLSGTLRNHNYVNSYASPGGRNVERYNIASFPESEVNPAKFWPDCGHATNSEWGGNPTQYSDDPAGSITNSAIVASNNYVMARNDSGGFTNIFELGNIYDPMQWSDQSGSGVSGQPGLWTNLTAAATASPLYGGRTTLRIGRPEFTRFAFTNLTGATVATPNMMTSAAALLDLFCTTNAQQYDESGLVNLNTAPAPVLRALAGSVGWNKDSAQLPTANRTLPNGMAEAFAQGVMRFRAKYPFYSPSQLAFIGTDPTWPNTTNWPNNAVFGNTNKISLVTNSVNSMTSTSLGVTEWNDQAAEEWFSKIYGLSTTQSRNFRCYVIAQLVNSNKVPIGPVVRKYYDIMSRQNSTNSTDVPAASASTFNLYEAPY